MMNAVMNKILNKIVGVSRRYGKLMQVEKSTSFLPNFSISGQRGSVKIGKSNLLGVSIILENASAQVEIGDNVYIGNSQIICKEKVILGNNILIAWGMECLILKGVTVGEGAIVAARSVVTKDVAPYTIVAGNPAKEVKKLER